MRRISRLPPKPAPISLPGRMGDHRTGMLSRLVCPRQPGPGARRRPLPGSSVGSGIDKSVLAFSEPRRIRDKAHRKFVSSQACLICGRQPSDPHHLRSAQPRALGRKVSDEFTVPLCRTHHREVHRVGDEAAWWSRFGVDPYLFAAALWAQSRLGQSVAELPNPPPLAARPAGAPDPDPLRIRPNGTRNRKTKPIVTAGAQ
jgi:hypothetical protein